jgi:hypothetical protein|tara:strand:- start:574 stop:1917 length:1344 start_codon:yes stop_codon:yes gene_type:complete
MASAKLSRTTTTPTSADIGTMSFWMKRSAIDLNNHYIISNYTDGSNYGYIRFKSGDQLQAFGNQSQDEKRTNRLFRDTSAWYHIVLRVDTTQSTASDRVRMYINGVQETSFSTNSNVSQNTDYDLFKSGGTMIIGHIQSGTATYFDGELAHFHYVDGQSYAPTVFGETDATTGIWKPKTSPGISQANYGNNGFFLKFDNSANMGLDSSGNSHNLTTSGTIIQNKDTPSNVYATLNPLDYSPNPATLQNCNTSYNKSSTGSGHNASMTGTLGVMTGKWYYEFKPTNTSAFVVGMMRTNHGLPNGEGYYAADAGSYGIRADGKMVAGSESSVSGYSYSANDIFGMAYDFNNGKFYVHVNGTYLTSGDPTSGSTGTGSLGNIALGSNIYVPFVSNANYDQTNLMHFNFGNGFFGTTAISSAGSNGNGSLFEYDVPTGYYALNTKNLGTQS